MANEIQTYRDQLRRIVPWWLRGWLGGRLLYAIGIQLDVLADMAVDAVGLRWSRSTQGDALHHLGQDRKIARGRAEPAATYVVRLRRWLDDHRTRGGPYAMLTQLHGFWAATPFAITLYYALGKRFSMTAEGVVTTDTTVTTPGSWARWWLYFDWPEVTTDDGLWSDPGTWNDGGVWDSGLSAEAVEEIRNVPREWNAAHATGTVVLVNPDSPITYVGVNQ